MKLLLILTISLLISSIALGQEDVEEAILSSDGNFETLLKTLSKSAEEAYTAKPGVVRIPFSRSLQAQHSSMETPRSVVSIPSKITGRPSSFIGFVPGQDQLELIVWDPKKQKFDFKIVEGFGAGKKPVIKTPKQETCLKCHQSGGPIFQDAPWSETENRAEIKSKLPPSSEHSIPVFQFDEEVRESNRILTAKSLCKEICKEHDDECKRRLLYQATLWWKNMQDSFGKVDKDEADKIRKIIPEGSFATISSVIPDRVVDINSPESSVTTLIKVKNISLEEEKIHKKERSFFSTLKGLKESNGIITYTDGFVKTPSETDFDVVHEKYQGTKITEPSSPLFKRPLAGHLSQDNVIDTWPLHASRCFEVPNHFIRTLRELDDDKIRERILNKECTQGLFQNDSLDEVAFSKILKGECLKGKAVPVKEESCDLPDSTNPAQYVEDFVEKTNVVIQKIPLSSDEQKKAMGIFKERCANCHNKKDIDIGIDWKNLNSIKKYSPSPLEKIISGEMPADEELSLEEKNLLIRALSN